MKPITDTDLAFGMADFVASWRTMPDLTAGKKLYGWEKKMLPPWDYSVKARQRATLAQRADILAGMLSSIQRRPEKQDALVQDVRQYLRSGLMVRRGYVA